MIWSNYEIYSANKSTYLWVVAQIENLVKTQGPAKARYLAPQLQARLGATVELTLHGARRERPLDKHFINHALGLVMWYDRRLTALERDESTGIYYLPAHSTSRGGTARRPAPWPPESPSHSRTRSLAHPARPESAAGNLPGTVDYRAWQTRLANQWQREGKFKFPASDRVDYDMRHPR